jgi:hypothetical protein
VTKGECRKGHGAKRWHVRPSGKGYCNVCEAERKRRQYAKAKEGR